MNKSKRLLSILISSALAVSSFSALVLTASAEETTADTALEHTAAFEVMAGDTELTLDPTAVIDFTNRSLTAEAQGNTTTFLVTDASTAGATGLAAAEAGDVLKLGSSQNGASKNLGYTAPLASTAEGCTEYGGLVNLSFKLEPMQVRTDKNASMVVQFSDISKTPILPITVGTGSNNSITIDGSAVTTAFGSYYVIKETLDFNNKKASVSVEDAAGISLLTKSDIAIDAANLAYLYFADKDWNYGYCAIDDIEIEAETIGTPVYYNAVVNTTRYAKLTTSDGDKYFADINGKVTIPLISPNTAIDYTISKVGYTDATGTLVITDADVEQDKPLTPADDSIIFIESEFGNENEAYVSAGGNRNDSVELGSVDLPAMSEITVDMNFAGFGGQSGQQKTWAIVTDAGNLAGIQISDNGMYAWTGWTGTDNMNQQPDTGAYTNGVRIGDVPSGDFTVGFVVDTNNKSITVSYGTVTESVLYTIDATKITGLRTGLYRYNGALATNEIRITEPDPMYMSVNGVSKVAKLAGVGVTRNYTISQTVITPDETFEWTLSENALGVSIADGVLTVTDKAVPGVITITATGTTGKTASINVTIEDFAQMAEFTVDGPHAYNGIGSTGKFKVTSAVDPIGDDVLALIPAENIAWTSSDDSVITIDADGTAEAKGMGTAVITATFTNGTAVTTAAVPVTVAVYSITVDATGDSTVIDMSSIINNDTVTGYQVTTAKDGVLVKQYVIAKTDIQDSEASTKNIISADASRYTAVYNPETKTLVSITIDAVKGGTEITDSEQDNTRVFYWNDKMSPVAVNTVTIGSNIITVETRGADKVEVAPIYAGVINTVYEVPAAVYNVTATVNNGARTDLYVNEQMLMNNINQGSDNWTIGRILPETAEYLASDINIAEGYAKFNLRDDKSSGTTVTGIKFVQAPSIVDRAQRIYVIGDSLVAKYYGAAPAGKENLVRTGWGDVLENYIVDDVKVTNLGNSGAWATGMLSNAFTNVIYSAKPGDIVVWESGYNDRAHSTVDDMTAAMTEVAEKCNELGVKLYFVTPNASRHDFKPSVQWAGAVRTIAEDTNTPLIDLSQLSYDFFKAQYPDGVVETVDDSGNITAYGFTEEFGAVLTGIYNNEGDTLHSSTNAANCWAAIVAQGLADAGENVVDTSYSYTFNDGTKDITVQVTPTVSID